MSLSRILNDEPSPALPGPSTYAAPRNAPIDVVQRDVHSPARLLNASPRSQPNLIEQLYHNGPVSRDQRDSRNTHPTSGSWDHYQATNNSASPLPSGSRSDERDARAPPPPAGYYQGQVHLQDNGVDNGVPHKRRKANHEGDNMDRIHVRFLFVFVLLSYNFRQPSTETRTDPAGHGGGVPLRPVNYATPSSHYRTEDDQFVSSDLEDCEAIWKEELEEYAQQTQRRYRMLEKWFLESNKVCFVLILQSKWLSLHRHGIQRQRKTSPITTPEKSSRYLYHLRHLFLVQTIPSTAMNILTYRTLRE